MTSKLAPSGHVLALWDGDLEIASTPTRCSGWWLIALSPGWRYGARRGKSKPINYTPGSRPYRRRRTGTDYVFSMVFGGRFTPTNYAPRAPGVTPWDQMWLNWNEFNAAVVADPGGDGDLGSVLTAPDGITTVAAPVQVLDLAPGAAKGDNRNAMMRATLTVHVLRGGWIL